MEASTSVESVQWYPSKVDWWLGLLLCVPPVASVAACLALVTGARSSDWMIGLVPVLIVAVVYFGLVFPMRYGLDETNLIVRFGVCRQRIPLADISEVRPTRNPLSSPALSLDRLRVQYGLGFLKAVMISPADRDGFLDDLARRGGLRRDGDRLIRE
jgi:hypothetical protein